MEIVLFKRTDARLPDDEARIVRKFLFQSVDGATERDKKAWRDWWRAVGTAPAGEYFTVTIKRRRNSKFHRLIMKVLTTVFEAQEQFTDLKIFRAFISMGAGHVDYVPNADGELCAIPKSLSFEDCSEDEARIYFENACIFLRTGRAQQTLWPALSAQVADKSMMELLRKFDREI
jgi:hypothetical protein